MKDSKRPHIVVVGAGFGGVKTAKLLAKLPVDVTVVDRNNFHVFQPLLYQLSTSELDENEIAYPIRAFFRNMRNVNFYMAHAEDFDPGRKTLITDHGELAYDYLVLAAGATTNFFGMESVAKNSFGMKTLQEAIAIRNHVLRMFENASKCDDPEERRRMLTFICVGGGPTGVECAGALSELIYGVMAHEYHGLDFSEAKVILVEAMDSLLAMMPEELREETVRVLRDIRKVDVRVNTQVMDYDGEELRLKDGSSIPTRTVIWAAGVKAVSFIKKLGAETDRAGRVMVEPTLQVKGHPDIFAIGDCAHFLQDGRPLATVAPVATQQAEVCAENIKRLVRDKDAKLETFTYKDVGAMATICRGHAVVAMGSMKMRGFFAWVAWMVVHLMRLAGTYTNLTVAYKWFWNFLFGLRLGRVISDTKMQDE
ncbi:MAG: NAD(P)/FAD-dependent oxidoreductase [Oscillospiraceae bacterium]|nr:NAD(P)/FAD-dependent oxidoreductase [Oscillospiraceae bacterium]